MTSFCGRVVAYVLAFVFVLAATPALTQTLDDALTKFAADSFSQTEEGITGVVATGSPRAQAIIEALQSGRLVFDPAGKKYSSATAAAFSMPSPVKRYLRRPPTSSSSVSTIACVVRLRPRSER